MPETSIEVSTCTRTDALRHARHARHASHAVDAMAFLPHLRRNWAHIRRRDWLGRSNGSNHRRGGQMDCSAHAQRYTVRNRATRMQAREATYHATCNRRTNSMKHAAATTLCTDGVCPQSWSSFREVPVRSCPRAFQPFDATAATSGSTVVCCTLYVASSRLT